MNSYLKSKHRYSNLNVQIWIKDWQNKVSGMRDLEQLVWGFKNQK